MAPTKPTFANAVSLPSPQASSSRPTIDDDVKCLAYTSPHSLHHENPQIPAYRQSVILPPIKDKMYQNYGASDTRMSELSHSSKTYMPPGRPARESGSINMLIEAVLGSESPIQPTPGQENCSMLFDPGSDGFEEELRIYNYSMQSFLAGSPLGGW
jgi:hypothetical protein